MYVTRSIRLLMTALLGCLLLLVTSAGAAPGALAPQLASADPLALLAAQQAKLMADDGAAYDYFGRSVAISGDTAVVGADDADVGANTRQGAAYVFVRSGATWSQQAKLTAADGAADDWFGDSVAISGDTVVVGAYGHDVGAGGVEGAAYVFLRSGTSWTQQATLTSGDGKAGDYFSRPVAIAGDTVVVGASNDSVGSNSGQGSAYVFVRSGVDWSQQARLTAADGATYDWFGSSVSISHDTVVVGAFGDDVGTKTDQGSAYVFVRSGSTWSQQAKLRAADGEAFDAFGGSIAVSGSSVVVGAANDTVGTNGGQGSAYVFARSGTKWSQQARLRAAGGDAGDAFGVAVAISGAVATVGASHHDVGANAAQGSAWFFVRCGSKWRRFEHLVAADGEAGDWLGGGLAISRGTAVASAYGADIGANANQGAAYVFLVGKPARPVARVPKGRIVSHRPTFRWRATAGAASYEVRVYRGSKLLKKKTGIKRTSWRCSVRLPGQRWLTWKVRARNVAGLGPWSAKPRFWVR